MDYDVGDLVKDYFDRTFIVVALNSNRDKIVYNVSLSQISGKPISVVQFGTDGYIRMFPTDVRRV